MTDLLLDSSPSATAHPEFRYCLYGAIVSSYGGVWMTIGVEVAHVSPPPSMPANAAGDMLLLLGTWDHKPTDQEVDLVTPPNHRTYCPACGVKNCDDDSHAETTDDGLGQ